MMRACRKLDFSSKNLILFIGLCLSVDITLLSLFSSWLATAHGRRRKIHLAGIIITSCLVSVLLTFLKRAYRLKVREDVELAVMSTADADIADADFLKSLSGLPTRFSFKDLESATNAFSTKLGRGGFGSVYAGTLPDGTKIAVKRLEKEGRGQKEFCAEVATISRIRHVNLISLKGFCAEGSEKLLVYEYMPRKSLDQWIFHSSEESQVPTLSPDLPSSSTFVVLNWNTRYHIALETARGLAYLHEECEESILHLDVKPQNILLDECFRAKVADFGLSRTMDKAHSRVITTVRGTPGYLAPEWLTDGGIDVKTDVYGFGMVVLELVSGRRSVDQSLEDIEHWFLPAMAFKKVKENHGIDIIDPLLHGTLDEESCNQAHRMIKVALWCIQEDGAKRPSMSSVVQMLEGKMEVLEPPLSRSFLASRQRAGIAPSTTFTIIDAETLTLPR